MMLLLLFPVVSALGNSSTTRVYIVGNFSSTAEENRWFIIGAANRTFPHADAGFNVIVNFSVKAGNKTTPHGLYNFSAISAHGGNHSGKTNVSNIVTVELFKADKGIIPKSRLEGEPFFINLSRDTEKENPFEPNRTNSTEPGAFLTLRWQVQAVGPPGFNWSFQARALNTTSNNPRNVSAVVIHDIVNTLPATAAADVTPPSFENFTLNVSSAKFNDSIKWSARFFDETQAGTYTCGYNNGTSFFNFTGGSWTNASTANCNLRVNSTRSANFTVQMYFKDDAGNGNKTGFLSFIVDDSSPYWAVNITNKTINENSGLQLYETITNYCRDDDGDSKTLSVQQENSVQLDVTVFSGNETIYVNPGTDFVGNSTPTIGCTANSVLVNTSFRASVTDQNPAAFGTVNTSSQNATYGQKYSINITWTDTQGIKNIEFRSNYSGSWQAYPVLNISSTVNSTNMDVTFNFSGLEASAGLLYFNFTANDTSGNKNETMTAQTINVSKAVPRLLLFINGTNGAKSVDQALKVDFLVNLSVGRSTGETTQGVQVQLWTNLSQADLKLWDNGTSPLTNITALANYATGAHRVLANMSESENLTAGSNGPFILTVSGITLVVNIGNNGNFSLVNITNKDHRFGNFINQSDTVGIFNITVSSNTTFSFVDIYARINTTFSHPLNITYFPQVANSSRHQDVVNLTTTYQRIWRNVSRGSNVSIWGYISLYNYTQGFGTHFQNISFFNNITNATYTTNRTYISYQWLFEGREAT